MIVCLLHDMLHMPIPRVPLHLALTLPSPCYSRYLLPAACCLLPVMDDLYSMVDTLAQVRSCPRPCCRPSLAWFPFLFRLILVSREMSGWWS